MDQNTSSYPMHGVMWVPLAPHVSPHPGEPNWASACQNHAALHSILHVPSNHHSNSWSPAHLTVQPSPDCKPSLSFRDNSYAGTRCDTGNILMTGRHLAHHYSLQFFISTQESPQIPLHLAFWKLHFLQLKECLCSSLHIIFTPCATRDADITWHNTKEGILSFVTRFTILLQAHWENPLTRHTNPSAFNSRAASSAGGWISLIPSNFVWFYYFTITLKKKKEHSDGVLFCDAKSQPLLGVYTSEATPSHGETGDTRPWASSPRWYRNFNSFWNFNIFKGCYLLLPTFISFLAHEFNYLILRVQQLKG